MSRTVSTVRIQTQSAPGGVGKDFAYSVELAKSGRSKCSSEWKSQARLLLQPHRAPSCAWQLLAPASAALPLLCSQA